MPVSHSHFMRGYRGIVRDAYLLLPWRAAMRGLWRATKDEQGPVANRTNLENSVSACSPSICSDMDGADLLVSRPTLADVSQERRDSKAEPPLFVGFGADGADFALDELGTSALKKGEAVRGSILHSFVVTSPSPYQSDIHHYSVTSQSNTYEGPDYRSSFEHLLQGLQWQCKAQGIPLKLNFDPHANIPGARYLLLANRRKEPRCSRCVQNFHKLRQRLQEDIPELARKSVSVRVVEDIGALPYCQQVQLFHLASGIIGPHGSQNMNAIYSFHSRFLIELHPDDESNGSRDLLYLINKMNGVSEGLSMIVPGFKWKSGGNLDDASITAVVEHVRRFQQAL
mmetsp:Transcript_3697/g.13275  ORF Transcript_3697/g.13275 Transcript_3697/m.13275 type:complete len:341 (-) Transcript_3697:248-1270(-)